MPKPEFVYVTYIETTPEKLWEALTSSEFSRRYWFNTDVVSDWKVGSPFALVMNGVTTMSAKFSRPTGRTGCPTPSGTSATKNCERSGRQRSSSTSSSTATSCS